MQENKNISIIKDALILFSITLIASFLLGIVNEITKDRIKEAEERVKAEAYAEVFKDASNISFDNADLTNAIESFGTVLSENSLAGVSVDEAGMAYNEAGEVIGYVLTVTSNNGYNGEITIAIGITKDSKITGISFIALNETASLGMEADKPKFKEQFIDKGEQTITVVKSEPSDNEIQALSGATITSRAVVQAVNAGILFVKNVNVQ